MVRIEPHTGSVEVGDERGGVLCFCSLKPNWFEIEIVVFKRDYLFRGLFFP